MSKRVLVKVICQHCQRVTTAGWLDELGRGLMAKYPDKGPVPINDRDDRSDFWRLMGRLLTLRSDGPAKP